MRNVQKQMTTQTSQKKPDAHSIYDNSSRAALVHGENCDEKIAFWQYLEKPAKFYENGRSREGPTPQTAN